MIAPAAIAVCLVLPPIAQAVTVVSSFQHRVPNSVGCTTVITRAELSCLNEPLLLLTPAAPRTDTVWVSGNDRGEAVGQLLSHGISHFGLFADGLASDVSKKLGGPGAFSSVDQLGEAVGTTYQHGTAFPFYRDLRTGSQSTLSLPGQATGIAIGPKVAVNRADGDGGIWNPDLHSFLDFGPFTTTGINAAGFVVGHLPNGDLGFAMPNGSGGVLLEDLGIQGSFSRVSLGNVATGYETQGKRIIPIEFDLGTWKLTQLDLPPGYRFGAAIGSTDTGKVVYGNVFKNVAAFHHSHGVPVEWTSPSHPTALPGAKIQLGGARSGFVSSITDTGISFGAVVKGGEDVGFIDFPAPLAKLFGLEELSLDLGGKFSDQVAPQIFELRLLLRKGEGKRACAKMRMLGPEFKQEAQFLEDAVGFFAAPQIAGFDDLSSGLADFAEEVGCPPPRLPLASPTLSQYPYALPPVG